MSPLQGYQNAAPDGAIKMSPLRGWIEANGRTAAKIQFHYPVSGFQFLLIPADHSIAPKERHLIGMCHANFQAPYERHFIIACMNYAIIANVMNLKFT